MDSESAEEKSALAREILTVSVLNRAVAGLLSRGFPLVRVRGEVANFTRAHSGHWYFTLKDEAAQVRCAMFRGRNMLAGFVPREGDGVEILAQVGLYEPRGEYQLNVESLQRSGLGQLYERFLRLKDRLASEGLFGAELKRPLPVFPRRIGVVTSLAAAALRDVLTTLARRSPQGEIIIYPVPVQGEGAGGRIAAMLEQVSRRAEVDVVLLVRGGGSIEDLWAFNEEAVARAIRACAVPVVVGVGHESDTTIADLAADLRAPTPTAAAEMAAPARQALLEVIADRLARARRVVSGRLQQAQQRLDYGQRALATPRAPLQTLAGKVHALALRMRHALAARAAGTSRRCDDQCTRLRRFAPDVASKRHRVQQQRTLFAAAARHLLNERQRRLHTLTARLEALDPQAVLTRGYALATDANGRVVVDSGRLRTGDLLHVQFARGRARASVLQAEPTEDHVPTPRAQG